jgi:hypothetical protein
MINGIISVVPGPSFGLAQNMADFTNMAELTG